MQERPNVFISATSADLGSYRRAVRDILLERGVHPIAQDDFECDYQELLDILRQKIDACDAVICLLGFAYGRSRKTARRVPHAVPTRNWRSRSPRHSTNPSTCFWPMPSVRSTRTRRSRRSCVSCSRSTVTSSGSAHTSASLSACWRVYATKLPRSALPLYRRALEIDEAAYGATHPRVATYLNNLAFLLRETNRLEEAEPLYRRMVSILKHFNDSTGHEHTHWQAALANYSGLLQAMGLPQEDIARPPDIAGHSTARHASSDAARGFFAWLRRGIWRQWRQHKE